MYLDGLLLRLRVFFHEVDKVLARLSTASSRNLIIIDHAVGEMHDLEVHLGRVELVEVLDHVGDGAWSVPLTRVLVVDETHPHDVLHGEDALGAIGIVIHQGQNSHVRRHVCA